MKFITALCGSASLLAMAAPALAQEAVAPAQTDTVVVTGSRIVRNGYTAPTPVTVAPVAQLMETTPSNIPDALNKLPQFSGSSQSVGSSTSGGPSNVYTGNYLNLRSMGAIRTLVLLDGRRMPSSVGNGSIDTNTLPQALVQRVDVVTGGASAVYGSDAVTGVVNFILDTHYTGLKMQVQDGISARGDVPSAKVGIAFGTQVFDRGHFIFSAEHYQNAGIKTIESRSSIAPIYGVTGAGTAQSPFTLTANTRISTTAYGGLVGTGPFAGQQFVGTGVLAPFNPGTPTGTAGISSGGDGAYLYNAIVQPPLQNDQVFGRFEYEFAPNFTGFVQLNATRSGASNFKRSNTPNIPITIFSGNAYLPANAQTALTGTGTLASPQFASFVLNRYPRDFSLGSSLTQLITNVDFTAGVKGKLFDRYNWETYYSHGQVWLDSERHNNINSVNLLAAADAVKDSSGNIVCRVTVTNPGLYPGCSPVDLFGEHNQSAQSLAYIYQDTHFNQLNKMDDFATSVSGDVVNAWAGPLSAALNFEYRRQSFAQSSTADPATPVSVTGIRLATAPKTNDVFDLLSPQGGQNSVWEVGGEAVLPLLHDLPLVKRLEASAGARYTDYSSSGSVTTWKLGLNYQPFDDLRFRYTESRDIRAPTLSDLFSGQTVAGVAVNDPHTGKTGNTQLIGGGNPNLVPEIARTTTVGAVYHPSWFPRFEVSVDYFNINIANGIGAVAGNNAAVLAECEASNGTSPLCASIIRPLPFSDHSAANFPTAVLSQSLNVAAQYTHGVDVEASYRITLADIAPKAPGALGVRLLYTYQPVDNSQSFASSPVVNAAGVIGLAAHRATLLLDYAAGPFSLNWESRYSSPVRKSGNPLQIYADPNLPSYMLHDISVAYRFKAAGHDMQASLAISNLFDQQPRIAPSASLVGTPGNSGPAADDDIVGRYYTFGLKAQF